MNRKLENKTALITGAALKSGQGAAEAQLLAENGVRAILAGVQDAAGEECAQAIRDAGGDAHYRDLNVADEDN